MSYLGTKPGHQVATAQQIADGVVTDTKLASNSVTTSKVLDANITQQKLAANVAGNGPAFYAATSVSKTVSNATATEIAGYNTALFDTASCFNATTGRFTPTVAGYYQVSASADFGANGISACSIVAASIYKNGSAYFSSGTAVTGSSYGSYSPSTVVYLNGTTDYVSVFVFQNTGLTSNQFLVRFGAAMVRAA